MNASLTDILCTRCGLCCNGSLFVDVELAGNDEASALEVMGLQIEDAEDDHRGLLLQPCAALQGKRCGIYPHRPECCRTFECGLLQAARRGTVSVESAKARIAEALKQIARVKELIGQLSPVTEQLPLKEHCVEAISRSEELPAGPELKRKRAELQSAMASVEKLIQETFLGRP